MIRQLRSVDRLGRSVLAVTTLLVATTLVVVGSVILVSLPPRPVRSALAAVHAMSFQVAAYWLVVVALLAVADRIADGGVGIDRRGVQRLAAVVFVGALAVEASPLVRLIVEPATRIESRAVVEHLVTAVQAALYPAAVFLGTGLAALTLRDGSDTSAVPLAAGGNSGRAVTPAALGRMGRVVAVAGAAAGILGVAGSFLSTPEPYAVLVVVEAGVEALGAVFDHLVLGAVLVALFAYGATARALVAAAAAVLAGTFLLGIGRAIVGAVLGVVVVGTTLTPIPAVESAALVDWPDPLAWSRLALVGSAVAAGVGFRTIQAPLSRGDSTTDPHDTGVEDTGAGDSS